VHEVTVIWEFFLSPLLLLRSWQCKHKCKNAARQTHRSLFG